jgi:uncharacterized protein YdeI (YjbR/CyaY-like superfamily)
MGVDELERVEVRSGEALRAWLEAHHAQEDSVWLVTFKKVRPEAYVSREAVLDELLCFGWIDGVRKKLDDQRTMQLISPRRVQHWTATYKERAARLIAEGRMHAAGFASIERGKASGSWDFMADVDARIVPDDLAAAMAGLPPARTHWEAFAPSYQRNLLRWIKLAKTDPTRRKRVARVAEAARDAEKMRNF